MAKIIVCHEMFNVRRGSFRTSVQSDSFHYTLFIACSKHAPSKGACKSNASHEITNFKVMVMISIIFHKAQNLRFEAKGFKHGFQLLCQPFPISVISFKKAYRNMMTLPILG